MAKSLEELVEQSCGGCYGIEWTLADSGRLEVKSVYNPQWRIEAVKKLGLEGLYTTSSTSFTFAPGEGLVGKTFADQKQLFVKDLQELSSQELKDAMFSGDGTQYVRADLAKQFGLHSAVFIPSEAGVLEIGTTRIMESALDLLSSEEASDEVMARHVSSEEPPAELKDLVEKSLGACYGIEWRLSDCGQLRVWSHYNPQWRIEAVKKLGLEGLYTTSSRSFTFAPGEGLVGKTFADQKQLFVKDLQELSSQELKDAMFSGDGTQYVRADLAKQFGLHSAVFIPSEAGVLEIGTEKTVAFVEELIPPA